MAEGGGEILATRLAFLELRDERRLVQEGYELLDEKRVLLATEILRELRQRAETRQSLAAAELSARQAFAAAVATHGFDDLQALPPRRLDGLIHADQRSFLGLGLLEARLEPSSCAPAGPALRPSPEARACATAFQGLTSLHASLAALELSLRRLTAEYRRTERRARALENVVLPEVDANLRFIEEQLDALDQEEAIRVRNARPG
jgi:V/A-type H+-transporting ATPase subunit D